MDKVASLKFFDENQTWWHLHAFKIPAIRRLRKKDCFKFEVSMGCLWYLAFNFFYLDLFFK